MHQSLSEKSESRDGSELNKYFSGVWNFNFCNREHPANFNGYTANPINTKSTPYMKTAIYKTALSYRAPDISYWNPLGAWVEPPKISSNICHTNVNKSNSANIDSYLIGNEIFFDLFYLLYHPEYKNRLMKNFRNRCSIL